MTSLDISVDHDRLADREVELVQRHDVVGRVELAVRARVADVPGELLAHDLDLQAVGRLFAVSLPCPSKVIGPRLATPPTLLA